MMAIKVLTPRINPITPINEITKPAMASPLGWRKSPMNENIKAKKQSRIANGNNTNAPNGKNKPKMEEKTEHKDNTNPAVPSPLDGLCTSMY